MTTVIIPWRAGDAHREAALNRVTDWWRETHPDWDVRIGDYPSTMGGWCKSLAVISAGPIEDDEIVVMSDADVICEQVDMAIKVITSGRHLWAMPHRTVYRLTEHATASVIDKSWWPTSVPTQRQLQPFILRSYAGYPGGGLVVLTGKVLNRIPMDPRFIGWGQEDHSWSLALSALAGAPWRGRGSLWHLWHPPSQRAYPGIGSPDGLSLWHRYRSAANSQAMGDLVSEARQEISNRLGQAHHSAGAD